MSSTKNFTDRGFTLIEIVLAIAILAVIMSVTYTALTQIIRSKNVLDDRRELNSMAYAVLNRMVREYQLAYSGIGLLPKPSDPDGKQLPGNVNLIGEPKTLSNGKRGDTIRFMALEGGQYLPDGGTHSGLVQLTYRVEEDPEGEKTESQTYLLIRDETPVIRPFEKAFGKTMTFPVIDRIVSLEYRYYDSDEEKWVSEWKENENPGLPTQLELRIELLSPKGELNSFVTTVPLRSINPT